MTEQRIYTWSESFSVYLKPRVLTLFFLGFSAGLPYLLVFSTLILWLKTNNIEIAIIGYFSFIGITYSVKIFWAPIVDNLDIPVLTRILGHRRSWILVAQIGIASGLILMGLTDPNDYYMEIAGFALLVAFSSATQDINIDAFRIESAATEYQAAMAALYVFGYRIALLVAGAVALYIADYLSWSIAYFTMAAFVAVGIITILLVSEPSRRQSRSDESDSGSPEQEVSATGLKQIMSKSLVNEYFSEFSLPIKIIFVIGIATFLIFFLAIVLFFAIVFPIYLLNSILTIMSGTSIIDVEYLFQNYHYLLYFLFSAAIIIAVITLKLSHSGRFPIISEWVLGAVVGPFLDFFHRFGIQLAFMILCLIAIYRMSDIFMGSMAYALYYELEFTLTEIASITKVFGVAMTLLGAALGGVLVMRYGIMRPLLVGAVLVAGTTLCFAFLSTQGHDIVWLAVVIVADNISGGLATSAFIAYLSALVNKSYTATQYALFSSIMTLLPKFLSGFSGEIVESQGYTNFFIIASIIGIPTILLIVVLIMKKHAPIPVEAKTKAAVS
ncbi:MAG: MFS transporter [Thiohalomonadales bacterium]